MYKYGRLWRKYARVYSCLKAEFRGTRIIKAPIISQVRLIARVCEASWLFNLAPNSTPGSARTRLELTKDLLYKAFHFAEVLALSAEIPHSNDAYVNKNAFILWSIIFYVYIHVFRL